MQSLHNGAKKIITFNDKLTFLHYTNDPILAAQIPNYINECCKLRWH